MKAQIKSLVEQGIAALRAAGTLPADAATPDFVIERPRDASHGDFSTNAAMTLAKAARSNPRQLAQALVDALPADSTIAKMDIAGPGFINFHLAPAAWHGVVRAAHAEGDSFGRNDSGAGQTVGVVVLVIATSALFGWLLQTQGLAVVLERV